MKVAELKDRMKVPEIDLTIRSKSEPRTVNSRFGDALKVCDAQATDEDGAEITLTLWNDEIAAVNVGDRIRILNGWVSAFRDKLQLSAGKFGKIERLP